MQQEYVSKYPPRQVPIYGSPISYLILFHHLYSHERGFALPEIVWIQNHGFHPEHTKSQSSPSIFRPVHFVRGQVVPLFFPLFFRQPRRPLVVPLFLVQKGPAILAPDEVVPPFVRLPAPYAHQVVPLFFRLPGCPVMVPPPGRPAIPPSRSRPVLACFWLCYLCAFSSYSSIYLVQKTPLVARERWDHFSAPGPVFRCPGIEIAYKQEPLETTLKYCFNSEKRRWVLGEVGILKHHFEGLRLLTTEPSCAARGGAEPSIQTWIKFDQK